MGRVSRAVYDARNRVIVRLYREHDWLLGELAAAFDMSVANVHRILKRHGATLAQPDRRRRWAVANRDKAQDPAFRAAMAETIRETWRMGKFSGRRRLFADEPETRAEYFRLQKMVGAAEARRMLAEDQARRALRASFETRPMGAPQDERKAA